ncbi:hypothetical protein CFOL_v3_16102, partial [Cephalotus follicularis]
KVDAIKGMGFGGLLRVKQVRIRKGLCHCLLKTFDQTSCTMAINNKLVNVLEVDLASIFGLKNREMDVVTSCECGTMSEISQKLNLNDKGEIKEKVLEEELSIMGGVDDEFKGKFILYSLDILLCPGTRKSAENTFASNINWAKQVYHGLLSGIRKFIVRSSNYISGHVLILQVFLPSLLYIIFL